MSRTNLTIKPVFWWPPSVKEQVNMALPGKNLAELHPDFRIVARLIDSYGQPLTEWVQAVAINRKPPVRAQFIFRADRELVVGGIEAKYDGLCMDTDSKLVSFDNGQRALAKEDSLDVRLTII